jgi:hypothetical protein
VSANLSAVQPASYVASSIDIVKSVRQRWLLQYWLRLRRDRVLPLWSALDMNELDACFDDLSILDVLAENGRWRMRIFDHGKNVGAMYRGQCAGKYLEETLPAPARAYTLETYEQAVCTRRPVYTVSGVRDVEARPVVYERLLLPFGECGDHVIRIIAFLETISIDGAFVRRDLMRDSLPAAAFAFKAIIDARASSGAGTGDRKPPPARAEGGVEPESF